MSYETDGLARLEQERADELCRLVLAGMARSDQRTRGHEYVLGLLAASGRKTVRRIASCEREQTANEQRLHHFISRSTWSSRDVLGRLVGRLQAEDVARGWVVRPMVVEKHGDQSVGVKNEVVPCLGRAVNHQHVLASWFVGQRLTVPVDWRMVMAATCDEAEGQRTKTHVPVRNDSPTASHAAAALVRALRPVDRTVPVMMDAREADPGLIIAAARAKGLPFLLRIPGSTYLQAQDGVPPLGSTPGRFRAQRLAELVRGQARLVPGVTLRTASRTPVVLRGPAGSIAATLVGLWSSGAGWAGVWLTDMEEDVAATVARTDLVAEADRAFEGMARELGAADYEGRSHQGWYHHMAMVSVAHAVRASVLTEDGADNVPPLVHLAAG
ncbi:IS701 family transposase [Xylanimonas protaetiae]|nr:transposase [Xylanimonas protaetiae]